MVQALKDYTVASITPEFTDPIVIQIIPTVNFKFNDGSTTKTGADLETEVTTMIENFSDTDLEKFEQIFRFSQFVRKIDDVDTAIVSNITNIRASYDQKMPGNHNPTFEYLLEGGKHSGLHQE